VTAVDDLIPFLRATWDARLAQLDEDERVALRSLGGGRPWRYDGDHQVLYGHVTIADDGKGYPRNGPHIARWDPARVLAEVELERADIEAKRRILELHQPGGRLEGDGYPEGGFVWCETCGSGEPYEYPVRWPCATIKLLTRPYVGRTGWREEWSVEANRA
jgi:hypothetical protein